MQPLTTLYIYVTVTCISRPKDIYLYLEVCFIDEVQSWSQFHLWTSCFGILNECDIIFDVIMNVDLNHLNFLANLVCSKTWRHLISINILWDNGSVWLLRNIGHNDIFHGLVILLHSCRVCHEWMTYVWILGQYDIIWPHNLCRSAWPTFYASMTFPISDEWISYFDNESVWHKGRFHNIPHKKETHTVQFAKL